MASVFTGATIPTVVGSTVPATGYVVALAGHGEKLTSVTREAITKWVASRLAESAEPGKALGIWHDEGITYLDVVRVISERATAEALARDTGELAIYDLARKADIRV